MTRIIPNILSFWRSDRGAAAVEFAVVCPFFIVLFLSSFETAMMNIRSVMLERATDVVVRQLRINTGSNPSYTRVQTDICNQALMIPDCMNRLRIEMIAVDPADWAPLSGQVRCVRNEEVFNPQDERFENGEQNEMMLLRVCAMVDPFFPTVGVGKSMPKDPDTGAYMVSSSSAFVNEPL